MAVASSSLFDATHKHARRVRLMQRVLPADGTHFDTPPFFGRPAGFYCGSNT